MAEEFSVLEAELVDAAKQGNIDHVIALLRDVGKLHHLWQYANYLQTLRLVGCTAAVRHTDLVMMMRERMREEVKECLRKDEEKEKVKTEDLQGGEAEEVEEPKGKGERLMKGYMVSSVNEWGADQTRILLLTTEAVHRVKYNFHTDAVVSSHRTPLASVLRIEYGSFSAAPSSLTTFMWRREIEDQQGFRIYTNERDGKKSINEVVSEDVVPALEGEKKEQEAPTPPAEEFFREYRALLAEEEPWKEEVFMLEFVAALQAVKILTGMQFGIKLTKMVKSMPGGIFSVLHNANRRRQHGL